LFDFVVGRASRDLRGRRDPKGTRFSPLPMRCVVEVRGKLHVVDR
jgi:hypothetical protein